MTAPRRWLPRALAAFVLLSLAPPTALAHAELEESDPPDGATITTPYTLVARFTDELDRTRSNIVVYDAANQAVAQGGVGEDVFTMTVELEALPAGPYRARWRAFSTDGHIERGDISFTVSGVVAPPTGTRSTATLPPLPTPTPAATRSPTPGVTPALTTARPSPVPPPAPGGDEPAAGELLLGLLVAALLVGGLTFLLLRRREP
ncbi:MAG: copper resistance protein CopC [Chloroflexota bacterium]|nr:copper resistance protein CopC [Chloroflexota bacterium]